MDLRGIDVAAFFETIERQDESRFSVPSPSRIFWFEEDYVKTFLDRGFLHAYFGSGRA
jgi:hypothetical protein